VSTSEAGGTRELRLAVVCYGGSSLAIYMHGVTKELHRLVKGSSLLDAGLEPAADAASETVYRDLLRALADEQQLQTRVVVDVVAGTSAGGINGVFLAKALSHNLSQDALRDVWFDRGDMRELLRGPKWLSYYLRFLMLVPSAVKKSPLRGNEMAQWLFEALQRMDAGGSQPPELPSLVPDDGRLDLFVTMTDFYGADRQIPARSTSSGPTTTAASPSPHARRRASPASSRPSASRRSGSGCRTPTWSGSRRAFAATRSRAARPS
jgi:patatin-related protein